MDAWQGRVWQKFPLAAFKIIVVMWQVVTQVNTHKNGYNTFGRELWEICEENTTFFVPRAKKVTLPQTKVVCVVPKS